MIDVADTPSVVTVEQNVVTVIAQGVYNPNTKSITSVMVPAIPIVPVSSYVQVFSVIKCN